MPRTRKSSAIAKAIDSLKVALDQLMQLQDSYEELLADAEAYHKVKPLVASLNRELNPAPVESSTEETPPVEPPATTEARKRTRRIKENASDDSPPENGTATEPEQERQE